MFIGINLGNTVEPKPVAPGRYELTISTAQFREAKNDIELSIGINGHVEAPNIRHFISLPKQDDDAGKIAFKQLMLKRLLVQFGIPFNDTEGFSVEDMSGATASALLTLTEPDDAGNVYNRLNLDKLVDEPVMAKSGGSKKR